MITLPKIILRRSQQLMLKRLFDITAAAVGLSAGSPLLAAIAILVRVQHGSPVLFYQQRPGLHGNPFRIYKFRTMSNARDSDGNLRPDEERLTHFGKWLRSTSLDELPEFINVLKGDMSVVGPRPLLAKYLPHYTERERMRHNMRPGITGWAQVKGRNSLPWDERLELDAWYVDNWTPLLDMTILYQTLFAVARKEGLEVNPRSAMRDLDDERKSLNERF